MPPQDQLVKLTGQTQPAEFTLNKTLDHIVGNVRKIREKTVCLSSSSHVRVERFIFPDRTGVPAPI